MKNLLYIILIFAFFTGCATHPEHNAFKVDKNKFFTDVKVIALAPIQTQELKISQNSIKDFESTIENELMNAGYKVVKSNIYKEIAEIYMEKNGGVFDSKTGKIDENKKSSMNDFLFSSLESKYGIDVLLHPALIIEAAKWSGNTTKWHGAEDYTSGGNSLVEMFLLGNASGRIPVLSFQATIKNKNDILYVGIGGIELISHFRFGEFKPVPAENILIDSLKNEKSIKLALRAVIKLSEKEYDALSGY